MGRIDWLEIADMPEALKDGREVLLSPGSADQVDIGRWGRFLHGFGWENRDGTEIFPTHVAELHPPAQ